MSGTRGKRREEPQGTAWLWSMLNLLRAGALGVAVAMLVLAGAAIMISAGVLENGRGAGAVVAACLLGGFVGGVYAVRQRKGGALPVGLGVGTVMFLLLLSAGAVLYDALPVTQSMGAVAGACLCGGGLAGLLAGKPKKKRRA